MTNAAVKDKPQQAAAPKRVFKVTYRPGPQDMAKTVWNGVTFLANQTVPLSLDNKRHFVENDIPKQHVAEDGSYTTRTHKSLVSMIELAKLNPHFEVEGFPRFIPPIAEGHKPKTSEEYRSWAQAWFAAAGTDMSEEHGPREMLTRWQDEGPLRERIGVGEDDVSFLKQFFDMKVEQLKRDLGIRHARNDGGDM